MRFQRQTSETQNPPVGRRVITMVESVPLYRQIQKGAMAFDCLFPLRNPRESRTLILNGVPLRTMVLGLSVSPTITTFLMLFQGQGYGPTGMTSTGRHLRDNQGRVSNLQTMSHACASPNGLAEAAHRAIYNIVKVRNPHPLPTAAVRNPQPPPAAARDSFFDFEALEELDDRKAISDTRRLKQNGNIDNQTIPTHVDPHLYVTDSPILE